MQPATQTQPVALAKYCGECTVPIDAGELCIECALEAARLAVRETCSYVTRVEGDEDDSPMCNM